MAKKAKQVEGVYEKNPGNGAWYARLRVDGKLVRKAIGTKQQAKEYVEKARTIRRTGDGIVPTTAKRPAQTASELKQRGADIVTIGELCRLYLKHILLPTNPEGLTDLVKPPQRVKVLKAEFGERPAAELEAHEIKDWLSGLDIAPATRNRYKSTLSPVYRYGKERKLVPHNPCSDVPHFTVDEPQPRYMEVSEEDKLRAVVQGWIDATPGHHRLTRLYLKEHLNEITVAAGTGMRKGNQYGLTWSMIDFDQRLILVPKTKNGNRPLNYLRIGEQVESGRNVELVWSDFLHAFYDFKDATFFLYRSPASLSPEWQALLAAAAEWLSAEFGLPHPAWTDAPDYFHCRGLEPVGRCRVHATRHIGARLGRSSRSLPQAQYWMRGRDLIAI